MPRKKLTMKQKKWTRSYIKNEGNGTKAALEVYNTTDNATARVIASTNLDKPAIVEEITRLMNEIGITNKMLFEKLKTGLTAMKTSEFKGEVRETKFPDHQVRHKYLTTAFTLKDMFPNKSWSGGDVNISLYKQYNQMDTDVLKKVLREELKGLDIEDLEGAEEAIITGKGTLAGKKRLNKGKKT